MFAGAGLADVWSLSVSKDTNNIRMRVQHFSTSNFDSGWHTHPGVVIVQVQKGSLSYTGANCIKKTYAAGDTFIEIPNTTARVVGVGDATFTGTFIVGWTPRPALRRMSTNLGELRQCQRCAACHGRESGRFVYRGAEIRTRDL